MISDDLEFGGRLKSERSLGVLLKQSRSVPDEVGAFRFGARPGEFVLAFFGEASSERVVGVFPNLGIAGGLFDFGADELVF